MTSDWRILKFNNAPVDIIDGDRGKNYPQKQEFSVRGHCLFLNTGNVTVNGFDFSDCSFISKEKDDVLRKGKLNRYDIVMTTRGTVGNLAFYDDSVPYEHIRINSGMIIFRPDPDELIPEYLYHYLKSTVFEEQVEAFVSGSAQPQLPIRDIKQLEICIPEPNEQRSIARILGALDDKIELNRRMNHTLESIAQELFKSWFVDFDPVIAKSEGRQPYGMNAETAALFPKSFIESELGQIPKDWMAGTLGKLFPDGKGVVLTGPFGSHLHAHDYRDEGVPLILVKHVNDGYISDENLPLVGNHKVLELGRYLVKTGDIVFTRVGAVGRSAYVHPRHQGWMISGQMLRVRLPSADLLESRYLSQVYLQPEFIEMVEGHALGTTRPSLNTEILTSFKFIVPPVGLQKAFVETVSKLDSKIQSNFIENHSLASIRDALLPKLLSGEIRVKVENRP